MATVVRPPDKESKSQTRSLETTTRARMTPIIVRTTSTSPSPILPTGQSRNNFPILLGSSLAGAILLITIGVIIAIFCYYRQRNRKGIYFIPPPAFAQQTVSEIQNHDTAFLYTSDGSPNTTTLSNPSATQLLSSPTHKTRMASGGTSSSIDNTECSPGPSINNNGAICRPLSEAASLSELRPHLPLDPMFDLTYTSLEDLRRTQLTNQQYRNGPPQIFIIPPQMGLDNPVYDPDGSLDASSTVSSYMESGFLHPSAMFTSEQDLNSSVNLSKRRRNRMRSQTAAAIAAQKDATTSMFLDTDTLIHNDSVVIYNERTAL